MRIPLKKELLDSKHSSTDSKIPLNTIVRQTIPDHEKQTLLEQQLALGANLDDKYESETSLLHEMCFNCGVSLIQWLLSKRPAQINAKSCYGTNVLFYAAKYGNKPVLEYFLQLSEGLELAKDLNNLKLSSLYFALLSGDITIYERLQKIRNDFIFDLNKSSLDGLNDALVQSLYGSDRVHQGHIEQARYFIRLYGDKIRWHKPNSNGWYLIHLTAEKNKLLSLRFLVEELGLDITTRQENEYGNLAIQEAACHGQWDVFDYLLQKHIEFNKKEILFLPNKTGWNLLHHAAAGGNAKIFTKLIQIGFDVSSRCGANTILHTAVFNNKMEVIQTIFENKELDTKITANTKQWLLTTGAFDSYGNLAITEAIAKDNYEIFEYLLNKHIEYNVKDVLLRPNKTGWYLVHQAAHYGNVKIFSLLIQNRYDLNLRNNGWHAIHYAAEKNHLAIVKYILERISLAYRFAATRSDEIDLPIEQTFLNDLFNETRKNHNLVTDNEWENTPLHIAALNGAWEVFSYLFELNKKLGFKEIIVRSTDKSNYHLAFMAAKGGNVKILRLLKEHGLDLNIHYNNGWTPLHIAVEYKKSEAIQFLVLEAKSDINQKNKNEWEYTPLHVAAKEGFLDIAKQLVTLKANCELRDKKGWQATHRAARNHKFEVVKYLIEDMKMNVDAPIVRIQEKQENDDKSTPIHAAFEQEEEFTPLHLAIMAGCVINWDKFDDHIHSEDAGWKTITILEHNNANFNIITKKNGYHLIHYAAEYNHVVMIRYLVEFKNINVNSLSQSSSPFFNNLTPLLVACKHGNLEAVKFLIKLGAQYKEYFGGKLPIHVAVENNQHLIIRYFVKELGVNPNTENRLHSAPLHMAAQNGKLKTVKELIRLGAKADLIGLDPIMKLEKLSPVTFAFLWNDIDTVIYLFHSKILQSEAANTRYHISHNYRKRDFEKLILCNMCYMDKPESFLQSKEIQLFTQGGQAIAKNDKKNLITAAKTCREYMLTYHCDFNEIVNILDACKTLYPLARVNKQFFLSSLKSNDPNNHCLSFLVSDDLKLKPLQLIAAMGKKSQKTNSFYHWIILLFLKIFDVRKTQTEAEDSKTTITNTSFMMTRGKTKRMRITNGPEKKKGKGKEKKDTSTVDTNPDTDSDSNLTCSFAYKAAKS